MEKKLVKRFKNILVLVHYHEENRFSILRLSDAVTANSAHFFTDVDNLLNWNKKLIIESKFGEEIYPARFLQFGSNRKSMEKTIDGLIAGSISSDDVDIFQKDVIPDKRKREQEIVESKKQTKQNGKENKLKMKDGDRELIEKVKERIAHNENEKRCSKCPMLEDKLNTLKKDNELKDKEIEELKKTNCATKEKYKNMKTKYKNLKSSSNKNETAVVESTYLNELTVIGPTLSVESYRLSYCRNVDYSKFTGDLLDVVFGPEVLGTSVLKGIAGCKKISILNPDAVRDIQLYVSNKFSVSVSQVRNAIRQKLNVCHKSYKKNNPDNVLNVIENVNFINE